MQKTYIPYDATEDDIAKAITEIYNNAVKTVIGGFKILVYNGHRHFEIKKDEYGFSSSLTFDNFVDIPSLVHEILRRIPFKIENLSIEEGW